MSIRNLDALFHPRSVAVIGASSRPHSVGATALNNLVHAGFAGAIWPVNPKYDTLASHKVYSSVAHLPQAPDLALICTPPKTIPRIIAQLGARGTRAAIVLTAGLGVLAHGKSIRQAMLDAAKPYLLRILGPDCIGLLVPAIGLSASFAHTGARPGKLAFVSQSGALASGVLDWAKARDIGFSTFMSMGDSADIDLGDVLDYLASDADTHAILLYIENIRSARKFMSAARAAARSKPVLVIKAGRAAEGASAVKLPSGAHGAGLAGADAVYDAAIRRAGMLRVLSTEDLFGAVETLAHARPLRGERLTIMTNGSGPGVLAADALISQQGRLASLSPDAAHQLDAILPSTWSGANPVDILGDAPLARYLATLEILIQDPQSDAVLFIHAPTALVPSAEIARALAPLAAANRVIACWLGGFAVAEARAIFSSAGIATYDTPEEAVRGFMQMVQYRRNQNLLIQAPPSVATEFTPDRAAAQAIVRRALADGCTMLSEPDTKELLAAYGIPVVATRSAITVEQAVLCAQEIGFPVALKILSPDISHKLDVGGVVLDLETADAVRAAAGAMHQRLRQLKPEARLQGFSVQAMARWPEAHELIINVSTDPVFGPVILFGQGGIAVDVSDDHALGLPPLNMVLARDMVSRTRVAKLLAGYRNRPAADIDAICRTLIQVAQLVTDLADVVALDINPLLADSRGVMVLDACLQISMAASSALERLAIRPYPQEWEQWVNWDGAPLLLRPIKPEDGAQHLAFFDALDPEDVRYRMFIRQRELQPSQLARLTQIDYDREIAFIATRKNAAGAWETLGVARAVADPDNIMAEFAIIVRSDLKAHGLGRMLMTRLLDYCRQRGTQSITGQALSHNLRVLNLVKRFGFAVNPALDEPGTMQLQLDLIPEP